MLEVLSQRMTDDEFRCAARRKQGGAADLLDYGEFLEMELLRLGSVDRDFLNTVKDNFQEYILQKRL